MEPNFWISALALAGLAAAIGWTFGAARARGRASADEEDGSSRTARDVASDSASPMPVGEGRDGSGPDKEAFVGLALGRVGAYLEGEAVAPLGGALDAGEGTLEVAARDALVALEDLLFYLRPVPDERSSEDLNDIARAAGKEYRSEWDTPIEVHVPERATPAEVNREALLDALYLALHNAGTFGRGEDVEVVVRYQDGDCWVVVRDRGPGFEDEALERAFEPFYTTSDTALGLGLYRVRRIVEAMDGTVSVRNRRRGGGQVEIVLPEAGE